MNGIGCGNAAGLRHQNIVDVYDYGEAVDSAGRVRPYVVMELVEGTSLDDLLTGRDLPWPAAVRIGAQVAAALAHAHARGVVHRDVKPGNVMVTRDDDEDEGDEEDEGDDDEE